ncbi:LptA/OstA family protein [Caulobacter sp. NIBR1757]|uniref:LptA/OstA family protein n=1 Tax=Caulobacter sp. NIBR1757 TaxID=3016000 RepID=UPI0022EFD8F8|nr:LptA/OstA family protein [Caulobacter sp. NIBR1757]WGM41181.1 Lipopolysaccharide export system protein LptA [Caulobacter sp. NIBR1757]
MRKVHVMAAGALVATLAMAGAAAAQIAPRTNAPLDIAADATETYPEECRQVFKGDVEAMQAKTRLRAQVVNAYQVKKGDGCGPTEKLVAEGDVLYVQPDRRISARHAVYTAGNDTIVLTGDVVVIQGENVARAERAVINLTTGQSQLFAGAKGRDSKSRVRAVLFPSSKSQ